MSQLPLDEGLTRDGLLRWAQTRKPFDDKVWVGPEMTVADVKKAVLAAFVAELFEEVFPS